MNDKEIPILNSSDVCEGATLMRMWAGACAPTEVYVWGSSFETAFEMLVEYLDEHAPGCLVSHEEFRDLLDEAAQEVGHADWEAAQEHWKVNGGHAAAGWHNDMMNDLSQIIEAAEADLTVIGHTSLDNGGHIASHEWGGSEVSDPTEYREAFCRSLAEALEGDVEAIVSQLQDVREEHENLTCPEDGPCRGNCAIEAIDVRLQLTARNSVSWQLHSGDASYDTDHRGYWGAGFVTADHDDESLTDLARDLISQCLDAAAESV